MAKKWINCGNCENFNKCNSGQSRMVNVDYSQAIYNDIGCFNHEQYQKQIAPKQMNLFNSQH